VVFGELEIDRHLAHYGDIRDSNPLLGTPYWHWQGEKIIWFVISDLEGCCLKDCDLERDLSQPYRSDYERGRRDGPAPRIQRAQSNALARPQWELKETASNAFRGWNLLLSCYLELSEELVPSVTRLSRQGLPCRECDMFLSDEAVLLRWVNSLSNALNQRSSQETRRRQISLCLSS